MSSGRVWLKVYVTNRLFLALYEGVWNYTLLFRDPLVGTGCSLASFEQLLKTSFCFFLRMKWLNEDLSPFVGDQRWGWEENVDEGVGERGGKKVKRRSTARFQPLHTSEPLALVVYRTLSMLYVVDLQGNYSKCDWPTCFTMTSVWTSLTLWYSYTLLELLELFMCVFIANTAWALWFSPHTHK